MNLEHPEVHRLIDICEIKGGGTPDTRESEYWGGEIPWITSADIDAQNEITFRRKVTQKGITNSSANLVPKGSIIVVTRVGLGKVAIAPFDLAHSQDSMGLYFDKEKIIPEFLAWQIKKIAQHFILQAQGTTINGITKNVLKEQLVWIPAKDVQVRIIEKLSEDLDSVNQSEELVSNILRDIMLLKFAMMKEAFIPEEVGE